MTVAAGRTSDLARSMQPTNLDLPPSLKVTSTAQWMTCVSSTATPSTP
jgi:hypothetical protein